MCSVECYSSYKLDALLGAKLIGNIKEVNNNETSTVMQHHSRSFVLCD